MYGDPILMTKINTIRDFGSCSTLSAEVLKILKDSRFNLGGKSNLSNVLLWINSLLFDFFDFFHFRFSEAKHCTKKEVFHKENPNPLETFTKKILNGKLHFCDM